MLATPPTEEISAPTAALRILRREPSSDPTTQLSTPPDDDGDRPLIWQRDRMRDWLRGKCTSLTKIDRVGHSRGDRRTRSHHLEIDLELNRSAHHRSPMMCRWRLVWVRLGLASNSRI